MINMKAGLTISRIHGSEDYAVEIRIRDEHSRIEFIEMQLTLEQFATALFGTPVSEVDVELRGLEKLGLTAENKTEIVKCDPWDEAARNEALKAYEVDGWKARSGDINNSHNFRTAKGTTGVVVVFFRHVGESYIAQEHEQTLHPFRKFGGL